MKKLMVTLAVVAMAVGVQASQVDWKVTIKGENWKESGYTAMLFDSAQATALKTALANFEAATDITDLAYSDVFSFSSYTSKNGGSTSGTAVTQSGVSKSDSVFAVIFKGAVTAGTDYMLVDTPISLAGYVYEEGAGAPETLSFSNDNFTTAGTITAVTPEPTSGLLLLLGVAGMALRRRRV